MNGHQKLIKKMENFLTLLCLLLLFGCESKVEGTFYISNGSQDQPKVPLRLIVDNDTIFNQYTEYTKIVPDLQYIEGAKLTKGKHKIIFEVPNSELKRIENVEFDKSKGFFYHINLKNQLILLGELN